MPESSSSDSTPQFSLVEALENRSLPGHGLWLPVQTTVGVLRSGVANTPIPDHQHNPMSGDALRRFNLRTVQRAIDRVARRLETEIGVVRAEIIEVPVIFRPEGAMTEAGALTADMVNMLVVNDECIVPKPFGPVVAGQDRFELYLTQGINNANGALNVHYVNDWYTYHVKQGEIHCGTNTLRRPAPANLNAWLGSTEAEWWCFDG